MIEVVILPCHYSAAHKKARVGGLFFALGADPSAEVSVDGVNRCASQMRKARRWAGL